MNGATNIVLIKVMFFEILYFVLKGQSHKIKVWFFGLNGQEKSYY